MAPPEYWTDAKGSATEFVRLTLDRWLDRHGRQKVEENFFLEITLSDRPDPDSWQGDEKPAEQQHLYVSVHIGSAGYAVFGPTLRLLEKVHPRLPVTFYRRFVESVERWVRVYDHRDGLDRVEQIEEWLSMEGEAGYEVPDVAGAMPACMRRQPLSEKTTSRLLGRACGSRVGKLLRGLLVLMEKAGQAERSPITEEIYEQLQDNNPPVPALLAVFEKHDAIEGCFDEESQTMLEMPPEPNVILPLNASDPASVAEAFHKLAAMTETLAAASELIEKMPGNEPTEGERE
ncbi:MAG: hypothetical protein KIT09_16155 [Bryobacteraceae bacterium]|nr:hypothetical protein [Bryobacteraceae bacterium]